MYGFNVIVSTYLNIVNWLFFLIIRKTHSQKKKNKCYKDCILRIVFIETEKNAERFNIWVEIQSDIYLLWWYCYVKTFKVQSIMFLSFNFNFHRVWRAIELVKPSESTLMQRPQKNSGDIWDSKMVSSYSFLHLHSLLRNWASRYQRNKCIKSTGPKRLMNWVSNVSIVMKSKIIRYI